LKTPLNVQRMMGCLTLSRTFSRESLLGPLPFCSSGAGDMSFTSLNVRQTTPFLSRSKACGYYSVRLHCETPSHCLYPELSTRCLMFFYGSDTAMHYFLPSFVQIVSCLASTWFVGPLPISRSLVLTRTPFLLFSQVHIHGTIFNTLLCCFFPEIRSIAVGFTF